MATKRTKALEEKHLRELGILCGSVAILIAVGVFIKVGMPALVQAWTIYVYPVTYTPVNIGGNTTISWDAHVGSADYCTISAYERVFPTCYTYSKPRFEGGVVTQTPTTVCYASVNGQYGSISAGPIMKPTDFYISCTNVDNGGGGGQGGNSITVYPIVPTSLSSFSANPGSVLSGNTTQLSWNGTKGTYFSKCQLSGGQWGTGTDVTGGIPNQITTGAITAETNYSLRCFDTRYGWVGPLTTTVTLAAPVDTDATVNSPVKTGESATIHFHADSTDPPTNCRINNYNDTQVLKTTSGGCASTLDATYTTPAYTTAGTYSYKFYYYRQGWYLAKTVSVVVNPASCPAGQILNQTGTACVPGCTNGLNASYAPSCSCPSGQMQSGAVCVAIPTSCSNGLAPSYLPTCACPSGQVQKGTTCVAPGSINSVSANPTRVRKGGTTAISWSTSNMDTCLLRGPNTSGVISTLSTALSGSVNAVIANQSIFTLTCVDSVGTSRSQSSTVNIVPETVEQ